jgi:elongator complex protein 5
MTLLQTFITDSSSRPSTVILQSSSVQSIFPVLQHLLVSEISTDPRNSKQWILFSLLYPLEDLLGTISDPNVTVCDWLDHIPGYHGTSAFSLGEEMLAAVDSGPLNSATVLRSELTHAILELSKASAPICVVVDSVDTLVSDVGSLSASYKILRDVQNRIASRPGMTYGRLNALDCS